MAFFSSSSLCAYTPPQQKNTKKTAPASKTNANKGGKKTVKNVKAKPKQETSADVKQKQEATQKEIRQTEQQIKDNERSIKKGLNDLGRLEGDISLSKQKIETSTAKLARLNGEISTLQSAISTNEKELNRLREEYLKAVKKMRVARKQKSNLAFVFASENFNQALRRMRYLHQFSEWKDRQTAAIEGKTAELKKQQSALASARTEQDAALRQQQKEQSSLQQQYVKQDAIVADLRKNGEALKSHLSKKQAEANQLKSRIASLIAEEQRKAEEERRRKEQARIEAERKAEAARLAKEKAAREAAEKAAKEKAAKEEQARLLAEKRASSKAAAKAAEEEQARLAKAEREKAKKTTVEKNENNPKTSSKNSGDYAEARRRTSRSTTPVPTPSTKNNQSTTPAPKASGSVAAAGNFAGMKGSLPRPVSGAFRITSRFGRQSLPDLPDVVYDNPGIDAETAAGAAALSVYQGKVSGVYMIPGYHTVVIVNHGNYYTVYGNIANPSVKVGDAVNAGQRLGALASDEDDRGHSSIHFEVWRNREKLNPLEWIR